MNLPEPSTAVDFESHRGHLRGLAYRMLGSRAEAEDVVQDTWLRWHASDQARQGEVMQVRAFLTRIATNLCLDRIKSAQRQREQYVGVWLPEPLVDQAGWHAPGPEAAHELANDLSVAFLLALQRLSPLERAAFLLHEVFDVDMDEVAQALGRTEAACRQLVSRARTNVRTDKRRAEVSPAERMRLGAAFAMAVMSGDVAALSQTLADDVVFLSDGGGRVNSVPRPLHGAGVIAKALLGFARLYDIGQMQVRPALINGLDGVVMYDLDGQPIQTMSMQWNDQGRIETIYITRNPDKLKGLPTPDQLATGRLGSAHHSLHDPA